MSQLIVSNVYLITGRGIAVGFENDPEYWLTWCEHKVSITRSDGSCIDAIGQVEFARKVPPGEVQMMLFPELEAADISAGSVIEMPQ